MRTCRVQGLKCSEHGHGLPHLKHFPSACAFPMSMGMPDPPNVPTWFGWMGAGWFCMKPPCDWTGGTVVFCFGALVVLGHCAMFPYLVETSQLLRSLYFTPILFATPGDRTPNLTTITVTTNHYTPYPMQCPWSRLSHSLMAVHLMFTSCQILHHAYHTASHLGASCISSPLYDPYLASCSSHVLLMTHTRPIGYDPLI